MAVEVAREDAVEGRLFERQRERVALDEGGVRCLRAGDGEHPLARIEPHDLAAQMPRQEARAARHIQGAGRRQLGDQAGELLAFLVPARPCAIGKPSVAKPPVVVLGCARVVVRLHGS